MAFYYTNMYCRNCGKELTNVSNFCPECGTKQNDIPNDKGQEEKVISPENHYSVLDEIHNISYKQQMRETYTDLKRNSKGCIQVSIILGLSINFMILLVFVVISLIIPYHYLPALPRVLLFSLNGIIMGVLLRLRKKYKNL